MLIWSCLLIPLVAMIFLALKFPKRMAIWEYIILLAIPLAAIFVAKQVSIHSQTTDTEFWNSYATRAFYFEAWNEYIHKTCTESYACGSDSKGNTTYCTRSYDCSYVEYHSE